MNCPKCGIPFEEYMPGPVATSTFCPGDIEEPEECGFYEEDEDDEF